MPNDGFASQHGDNYRAIINSGREMNDEINMPRQLHWLADEKDHILDDDTRDVVIRELIDIIGYDNTVKLVSYFGGTAIYIPKIDRAFRTLRNRRIMREFDGVNSKYLARKFGVSESTVRSIVGGK